MRLREFKRMKKGEYYYFKGMKFYHIGWMGDGMPMCTREQYYNLLTSFAYIRKDAISQFGEKIGTLRDIKKRKVG